jgi:predicted RNA-binding Zn-ribbon protein involved in translation (DUF1610 family)
VLTCVIQSHIRPNDPIARSKNFGVLLDKPLAVVDDAAMDQLKTYPRCAACGLDAKQDTAVRTAHVCPRCGDVAIVYNADQAHRYDVYIGRESRSV